MLQMLALAAMEPPVSFEADSIRDEKVKLLKAIRPIDIKKINDNFVRAQYGQGKIKAEQVKGYLDEKSVAENSKTETFVAARLFIDNWRWKGVPFYLRTGKAMKAKNTEIAVYFKSVPHSLFASVGLDEMPPNVLVFQIQPEEGMTLSFQAKRPGSKICMTTLDMNFNYKNVFLIEMPEAYQRLLLDCMLGDQTLFTRYDTVEASWKLLEPVLQLWQKDEAALYTYPAGSESFPQADDLIGSDGRKWRNISVD
jgi:glucose-6-phosphate 1-dehydrogenase